MFQSENVKNAYHGYKELERELLLKAQSNNGKIKRDDHWRCDYFNNPYLILEEDSVILERLSDVLSNTLDIDPKGLISMLPHDQGGGRYMRLFAELISETNWRGILTKNATPDFFNQLDSYFENGTPIGVKMFENTPEFDSNSIIKFSKKQFIEGMYYHGKFRIAPASYYAKGSHLKAIKDLETSRYFKFKALNEYISNNGIIEFEGKKIPIPNGIFPVEFKMDDYYLFSTCNDISRRMPTDFESDAALIIKDKKLFLNKLKSALLEILPAWQFLERDVYYYDPYDDASEDKDKEFWKHFAYAYQKEHRCILRSKYQLNKPLEPIYVELGSLENIAEIVIS